MRARISRKGVVVVRLMASFACVTAALPARAQRDHVEPDGEARALELTKRGDQAMTDLRFGDALEAYEAASALSADPALLYNKASALRHLERFPEALAELELFVRKARPALLARVPRVQQLISELKSKVASVTVRVDVEGARVLIGNKLVGRTPIDHELLVNAGDAVVVEVIADGYLAHRTTMDLPGNGHVVLAVALVPEAKLGLLIVRSPVPSAVATIDGESIGLLPAERALSPGDHKIRVHRDGYQDAVTSAVVSAGKTREVTIRLEKSPSVLSRWWFWTGVGVAVVGGTIAGVAVLTDKPTPRGENFTPGQVSGPLVRF